jgi:hypothetical protein
MLGKCFAALAGTLPAEQVEMLAGELVDMTPGSARMNLPFTGEELAWECFATLARKLPAEHTSKLWSRIIELAAKETRTQRLDGLCLCFSALVGKAPAGQADTLASRIAEQAAKETDAASLRTLAHCLGSQPTRRKESEVASLILRLARLSHKDRSSNNRSISLHPLLSQVGPQTILDALKQPGCVGTTRADLLAHLRQRYNRPGATLWELVDYLKVHAPELDLDSPLPSTGRSGEVSP